MSLSSSFELLSFQRKVKDALQSVERTLELERKPQLAADVDHTYGAKYGLVNLTSNAAIIAYMNCFEKLGLDSAVLKSIVKTKPATLRFDSSTACKFLQEVKVDVPVGRSYEEKEEVLGSDASKNTTKTRVMKATNHVKEFHWEVEVNWSISVYSGTSVEEKKVFKSRTYKTTLITQSKGGLGSVNLPPVELSLSWFLQQIDMVELTSQFKVDTEDGDTKTPRRNDAVQKALDFAAQLRQWCHMIESSFFGHLQQHLLQKHNPAVPKPHTFTIGHLLGVNDQHSIFNPILPLMEESGPSDGDDGSNGVESKSIIELQCPNNNNDEHPTLLSSMDISKLLNEHVRTLGGALSGIEESWPSDSSECILSSSEAVLSLLSNHLRELSAQYAETMSYIESMMENQLIAAIGKRLTPNDLDKFVKFHNAKLLSPMPQPFSHAIRRPKHYPVGLLSIESHDGENECIHSHSREVVATSNLKIPLSAATVLELTGHQYLHGYMNYRFGTSHKRHQLVARARQFSSFILVIGNMTDGSTLDPKDAIIVQNKDELLIPLLLDELPTAKEFKDAVKSLSPEQQRFAHAYRKMQLASSVFGICVIQIKPQLEALLGLPADALDKEMKLTQDLMELFVEYQVPSDLLSYNGFSENIVVDDKISNVRNNVKGVLAVVNAEKGKQLKMEQAKTEMVMNNAFQARLEAKLAAAAAPPHADLMACRAPTGRGELLSSSQPMYRMKCKMSAPMAPSSRAVQHGKMDVNFYSLVESSLSENMVGSAKREASEMPDQHPTREEEKRIKTSGENDTFKAMHVGKSAPNIREDTNIDKVDDLMDEIKEVADEISNALAQPADDPLLTDEDDLLAELHAIDMELSEAMKCEMMDVAFDSPIESSLSKSVVDQRPNQEEKKHTISSKKEGQPKQSPASDQGVDFTLIPQILDAAVEKSGEGSALRSTTVKTGDGWVRNRQENLLTGPKRQSLNVEEVKKEKNKAFDLLDALSRSGSLPIAYNELHVVVAVTHCFDKDVMSTVVCDNINPIEKLECSTLLLASAVHGVPARELIGDDNDLQRLEGSLALLLKPSENE